MSYLVFARKWRPKDFDEVVGQEHVTKTLKSAVVADKLAHAYLFAGPQGVGKTSCARILAKALNCEKGPTDKPCGVCGACREIAEGRSLDVIEIDGASNRGIDEIRTLRENVKFAPLNGRCKVYIIDEVHMLTAEAFNALLKTLEEPPAYVKFVFATTQPQKVLPTILSRCQRFDFIRIPNLKIIEKLKEISRQETVAIEDDVFLAVAKAADGSLRDAESILDQLLSFAQKEIRLSDVIAVLGIIEQDIFYGFVDRMAAHDPAAGIGLIAALAGQGKDAHTFLEGLLEYYRHLMVLKVVKASPEHLIDLPGEVVKKMVRQSESLTLPDIMTSISHIFAAQDMSRKIRSATIPLEILAVKLAHIGAKRTIVSVPPQPVESRPAAAEVRESRSAAPVRPPKNIDADPPVSRISSVGEGAATAVSFSLEDVKERWAALLENLSKVKMSLATYLKEASPVLLERDMLTIGFPKGAVFFKEALAHKDNMKILEGALNELMKGSLRLKLEIVEGLSTAAEVSVAEQDDPLLKSALDLFKGKVIKRA